MVRSPPSSRDTSSTSLIIASSRCPAFVDVTGIFAIARVAHRAQHLVADDFGKAQHGIQRRLELMAHGGKEGRLHLLAIRPGAAPRAGRVPASNFSVTSSTVPS